MNDEDFLARWSRRKREAEIVSEPPPPAPSEKEVGKSAADSETKPDEEFDLSALPSIDSITATTDVTAFLRKGVPLTLTREALRRAWLADPVIRDFVGLAENAWDFNDPNAMPGFGPLDYTAEEVRDLVARIVGDGKRVAEDGANSAAPQLQQDVTNPPDASPDGSLDQGAVADRAESAVVQVENDREQVEAGITTPLNSSAAAGDDQPDRFSVVHRTHGSALPR